MNLNEISDVLKTSLGIKDSPVGVALFKREEDIPKGIMVSERPLNYCQMVQGARLNGESFLAHADYHKCKGGAAGLGLLECPENISSGTLYFEKLHKCASKKAGSQISANMPRLPSGSTVATYVAPLDKMVFQPRCRYRSGHSPRSQESHPGTDVCRRRKGELQHRRNPVLLCRCHRCSIS